MLFTVKKQTRLKVAALIMALIGAIAMAAPSHAEE